jgi:hypothetical protein
MCGFLIGTACLIGLLVTLARGRAGCGSWGGGCSSWSGRHRWSDGPGDGARHDHHGGGGRWFLRGLFERLDTSPGQEKVILDAVNEARAAGTAARGEVGRTRADVAKAVRSASFDETLIGETFARHDSELETLRKAVVGSMAKIHAVLDDKQREKLAEMIESGRPFFGGFGGPYRRYAA